MAHVGYTRSARRDALYILQDIANEAGKASAAGFAERFEGVFDRVAVYPLAYPKRAALGAHVRIASVRPYVILYRYDQTTDTVTILRLLHGRREITSDFMKMS